MPDPYWFLPLESCTSLDDMRPRWHVLLEQHGMAPPNGEPHYHDALMSFIGMSAMSPHVKLAAVLAFGSAFDVDLRLAIGALAELTWEDGIEWPDCVAAAVSDNGPALTVATSDERLAAFVLGRLAGLRETMRHDGTSLDDWRTAFWNTFLVMACRHADAGAVVLGLRHGADPAAGAGAAPAATAAGSSRNEGGAGGAPADHLRVMQLLLDAPPSRAAVLAAALPAAAAADWVPMLEFLLAQGADIHASCRDALAAAARHLAFDAFAYLLPHDTDPRGADDLQVLVAAVESLDEAMIEEVLAAGVDLRAGACAALCAAFTAQPWDLYGGEPDFIQARADIVALLLRHGARCDDTDVVRALGEAWYGRRVVEALLKHPDVDAGGRALVASLAARAFGLPETPGQDGTGP